MTPEQQPDLVKDIPLPNHSTGPRTPEGKRVCRLKRRFHSSTNAHRYGLTGQINAVYT